MKKNRRRPPFRYLAPSLTLLLFACLFASTSPLPAKPASGHKTTESAEDTAIIPFSYDPENLPEIVVQVRINGNPPLPFLIDTGAFEPMVIDTPVARQLHLNHERTLSSGGVSIKVVDMKNLVIVGTDSDNDLDSDDASAMVADIPQYLRDTRLKAGDPGIAGIIGNPVLCESIKYVELDFRNKRLIAHRHPPKEISDHAFVIPIYKFVGSDRYLVQVKAGSQTAQLALDTGCTGNALVPPTFVTLADSAGSVKNVVSVFEGYLVAYDYFQIPELQIGDAITLRNLYVGVAPSSALTMFPPPVLGLGVLRHYHVWLDFAHNQMILSPLPSDPQADSQPPAGDSSPNPTFGAEFVRPPGGELFATYVMPGCLAAKAGLLQGDVILKIGGKDAASMTSDDMGNLLNQPSVDLTVRRKTGSATQDIEIKVAQP